MCYLCDQYGNPDHGGGLWYLNPENHARNMYRLRMPGEGFRGADASPETGATERPSGNLQDIMEKGDVVDYNRLMREREEGTKRRGMEGQVVPLRDADKVLELCSPIGLMACLCRKGTRGKDERSEMEYTCMGMGAGMLKWERWPERYKGGVKFVNIDEAKEWNHEMDRRGFVHILMLFGAPFIGGFCQCDYPDCGPIRSVVDYGAGMLRSHYAAFVDYDICNGCGICAQRCQFGALKFEVTTDKASVDQFKCFGCGLCESGCPRKAITLLERKSLPALAEVWS